jgi:K+-sensing histidine kinase KdpD
VSAGGSAEDRSSGERPGQSPLAFLLHALNQPLTGLQCSLELALVSQRSVQQYIHCLNEGLQLTGRMRILVEAIQALIEAQQPEASKSEVIDLDALLRRTVDELQPVADSKNVRILVEIDSALPVEAQRHGLSVSVFRLLESAVSQAAWGSALRINATSKSRQAFISVRWDGRKNPIPQHAPFSPATLALLVAQAGWEQAGAKWQNERTEHTEIVTIRLSLDPAGAAAQNLHSISGKDSDQSSVISHQ